MSDEPVTLIVGSRCVELRRQVGANSWVVLEEILLGSSPDETVEGRAITRATVRALATRTGLSKDTVSRSIQKLRRARVLDVEAERHDESGRFTSIRYLVDLSRLPVAVHHRDAAKLHIAQAPSSRGQESTIATLRIVASATSRKPRPVAAEQLMLGD